MTWKPDYLTLVEAKRWLRVTGSADDLEIAAYVTAASRAIDDHCHRQFGNLASAASRTYTAYPDYDRGVWVATIDDLADLAGLVVKVAGTTLTSGDYRLEPSNAPADGVVYEQIAIRRSSAVQPCGDDDELDLFAKWGWSAFPAGVVMACRLQIARLSARRGAPFGIAGSPDSGSEMRLLDRLDPDAAHQVRGLVRAERAA